MVGLIQVGGWSPSVTYITEGGRKYAMNGIHVPAIHSRKTRIPSYTYMLFSYFMIIEIKLIHKYLKML